MASTREPGLNSGLPNQDGLDDGTREALRRNSEKVAGQGVIVGGIQDVQRYFGELAKDDSEPAVTMPPGTDESNPTSLEHDAATATATASAPEFDDSYSKADLQAALDDRGIDYTTSETKEELIDRLNA